MGDNKKVSPLGGVKPASAVDLDPVVIVGKVPKPAVFYFMERGNLGKKLEYLLQGHHPSLKYLDKSVEKL